MSEDKYCIIHGVVEEIDELHPIDGFDDMVKVDIKGKRSKQGIIIYKEEIFESQLEAYKFRREELVADLEYVNGKIASLEEEE